MRDVTTILRQFTPIIIVKKTNEENYCKKTNCADTIEEEQTNKCDASVFTVPNS